MTASVHLFNPATLYYSVCSTTGRKCLKMSNDFFRCCKSKEDIQYNCQLKRTKEQKRSPMKTGSDLRCFGKWAILYMCISLCFSLINCMTSHTTQSVFCFYAINFPLNGLMSLKQIHKNVFIMVWYTPVPRRWNSHKNNTINYTELTAITRTTSNTMSYKIHYLFIVTFF